jgi:cytochrome c oxidase assembly protein subunit 15
MDVLIKMLGYYIPTEQQELFAAGKEYDKGQVIIKEALLVAKMILYGHLSTRTTGKKYTKHDYAIFNNPYLG